MKYCSRCGESNSEERTHCDSCGASFTPAPVEPARGRPLGGPLVGGPADAEGPVSSVGRPMGGPQPGQQQSPYGGPSGPPKLRYIDRSQQSRRGFSLDIWGALYTLATIAVVFGGGGFAVYKYVYLPVGPMKATRSLMTAMSRHDSKALSHELNYSSRKWFAELGDGQRNVLDFFGSLGGGCEEGREYELAFDTSDGKHARVLVKPGPMQSYSFNDDHLPPSLKDGVPIALVKEGKEWRVDLLATKDARDKAYKEMRN